MAITKTAYDTFNVRKLKKLLCSRGLPSMGNKGDLVLRLEEHDRQKEQESKANNQRTPQRVRQEQETVATTSDQDNVQQQQEPQEANGESSEDDIPVHRDSFASVLATTLAKELAKCQGPLATEMQAFSQKLEKMMEEWSKLTNVQVETLDCLTHTLACGIEANTASKQQQSRLPTPTAEQATTKRKLELATPKTEPTPATKKSKTASTYSTKDFY